MLKIIFHSIDGLGVGHMMRGINIARQLRAMLPCDILFVTNSPFVDLLKKEGFNFTQGGIDPIHTYTKKISHEKYRETNEQFLLSVIEDFKPSMVIFDLLVMPNVINHLKNIGIIIVYVLRELNNIDYLLSFKNTLKDIDLMLLSGIKDFFNQAHLSELGLNKDNVFFVGNIFREPSRSKIQKIKSKYKKKPDDFLITVTAGGGGFIMEARKFFIHVDSLSRQINRNTIMYPGSKNIRWCFLKGPLFRTELNLDNNKIEVREYEPDLPELFSISDLVIAGGGYNSINELIASKTPGLVYPFPGRMDSQLGRVFPYKNKGFLKIIDINDPKESLKVLKATLNYRSLKLMRDAYNNFSHKNGARLAAVLIINTYLKSLRFNGKAAVLRLKVDTEKEHFIYEEIESFHKYRVFFLTAKIEKIDKKLDNICLEPAVNINYKNLILPVFGKESISKFAGLIKKENIDIFYSEFLTDTISYLPLIKYCRKPLVVNFRGYELADPRTTNFLSKIVSAADKIVARSNFQKNRLIKYGVSPHKIIVIHGGINVENIPFKFRPIQQNSLKLLSAGRFVEKKGFDTLLLSFRRLLDKYPNTKLTIIGEGELKKSIEKQIEDLGIKSAVTIKSFLPHHMFIKELFEHDIFILLSKTSTGGDTEGIPNVLKEAMASGMPVISTNHAGIPDLIEDKKTGFLIAENDYEQIPEIVESIIRNIYETYRICLNSRFFIEREFDIKKNSVLLESVFQNILAPTYISTIEEMTQNNKPKEFRVDLHLSSGCNSRCLMCNNWKIEKTSSFSLKRIIRLFDDLKSFGVTHIRLHGQEPTLRKDILLILKEAKSHGFITGLKTNALKFDTSKKITKLIGLVDEIYLSVDSPDPKIHNLLRGHKQSFSRNIRLAKILKHKAPAIKIYFNSVLTKINFKTITGFTDMAKDLKIDKINFVHLNTNNSKKIKHLRLSKSQMKEFYLKIWPEMLLKNRHSDIQISVHPYFHSLLNADQNTQIIRLRNNPEEFEEEINNFYTGLYGKVFYSFNNCYGILDHATIDWKGNVYPCCALPRSPETRIGNILASSFSDIWKTPQYASYRNKVLSGRCGHKDYCSRNFFQTSSINAYMKQHQQKNIDTDVIKSFINQFRSIHTQNYTKFALMIYYAFLTSQFYREKFKDHLKVGMNDFAKLPYTTKKEAKNIFSNKENFSDSGDTEYGIFKTSACGQNIFLYSRPLTQRFQRMAASFLNTGGWKLGDEWLKLTSMNCIEAAEPIFKNSPGEYKKINIGSNITIPPDESYLELSIKKIREIYELIIRSKSTLIHANPTYLKLLLYRFRLENLILKDFYTIHSTYETLLPTTQKLLKKFLQCNIFDQYGCSETGPIAFTCQTGNHHIFDDCIYLEMLPATDINRRDIGRVIVTDLENKVMPFVKYFTGDFAYFNKEKCTCDLQSPTMGKILGREEEMLEYHERVFFPLELDTIFLNIENILIYQIIFDNNRFLVNIVPECGAKPVPTDKIAIGFKRILKDNHCDIKIQKVDFILPQHRGKYKTVIIK